MDTLTLKPLFTSSCFIKPPRYYSFFKFNKTARVYSQITPSPCPQNPKTSKQNHFSNWVVPVLQRVKLLASSQKRKWVSPLQACSDESEKSMNESCGGNEYLQNGAFGLALLSITSHAKVRISPFLAILAANPTFISGFFAWFVAQSMKVFLNFCVERKWDLRMLFACGGMPSSHSALCTALTTSVALCHGVADSLFPVCLGFSLIVMYDAIGVRRHAGMQAEVLNVIVADLFQGHPISQRKLKELLGHTPSQVFAGAVLGIFVACVCCQGCLTIA